MSIYNWKGLLLGAAFLTITAGITPSARADEWNKETIVTVNAPVEMPGRVLPAGQYVFELADTANRTVVEIFNKDRTQLVATVLAVPAYRPQATGDPVITLEERSAKSPEAIRDWFYAGENDGVEFTYPASSHEMAQ